MRAKSRDSWVTVKLAAEVGAELAAEVTVVLGAVEVSTIIVGLTDVLVR